MSIATSLQALQKAKTDIANAITQMDGVVSSGDGFADFAACIGTIPQGSTAPVNFEIHRVNVPTTLTGSGKDLLTGSQFIKDHINDEGFAVTIINVTPLPWGTAGVCFAYRGNRPICVKASSGGYYYGVKTYSGGSSVGNQSSGNPFPTAEWNGHPNADSTGRLYVNCNSTNGAYPAGDYLIVLAVVE